MSKKPTVLMILDGYGLRDEKKGNGIAEANTPVMDKLMAEYPFVKGNASGLSVGLPDGYEYGCRTYYLPGAHQDHKSNR